MQVLVNKITISYFIYFCIIKIVSAHEPIYGLGPETLPKHLNAIELGSSFLQNKTEFELSYGFGITQNWTVRIDFPFNSGLGNIVFRNKYALFRKTSPGIMKRLTAISVLKLPTAENNKTVATLGIANGYESRKWYYFSDISYSLTKINGREQISNFIKYNLVGGIRPKKTEYLKPDLVLLIELNGQYTEKSYKKSGGNDIALAPGFLLSYRNIMIKAGIQFGVFASKYVSKKETNALISIEYHF